MALPLKRIAVAFIRKGDEFLIAQRKPESSFPLLWELPGGKCDPGEEPAACVLREVREETGLEVEIQRGPLVVKHAYDAFAVEIHAFLCQVHSGDPRPIDSSDIRWIRWEEIPDYTFPEANRKVFAEALALWNP